MLTRPLPFSSPLIPLLLMILSVAVWAEMDLFVPSLPDMMHYFQTTEATIQWALSINFFGFFITSLLCGSLSDAFGRRPVLLIGTALFLLGSMFTVTAIELPMFLLGRFIQGIGVSAPAVVVTSIFADLYTGAIFSRWLAISNALISSTMALAPMLGAYLNANYGWRASFSAIAACSLLGLIIVYFWIPETLPQQKRQNLNSKQLGNNYKKLILSKAFIFRIVGLCFLITPYFVFVGVMSLLFVNELRIELHEYVFYQASIVGVFSFFNVIVSIFSTRLNLNLLLRWSIVLYSIIASLLFLHGLFLPDRAWSITGLMCALAMTMVIPAVTLFPDAMQVFPSLQGSASALGQSARMLLLAFGSVIAGAMYNGFYAPIGIITGVSAFLALCLIVPILKEKRNVQDTHRMVGSAH